MPADRTPRKTRTEWSAEEEAIWTEIAVKCLNQHMLHMVRADGRLESRHKSINAHLKAMINNMTGGKK